MSGFWEAYKHPKWQEMRLRIMQRDGFRCTNCYSNEKTLNVHHKYYVRGRKPWEYDPDSLETLCGDCHELKHEDRKRLNEALAASGDPAEVPRLTGFVLAGNQAGDGRSVVAACEDEAYGAAVYFVWQRAEALFRGLLDAAASKIMDSQPGSIGEAEISDFIDAFIGEYLSRTPGEILAEHYKNWCEGRVTSGPAREVAGR